MWGDLLGFVVWVSIASGLRTVPVAIICPPPPASPSHPGRTRRRAGHHPVEHGARTQRMAMVDQPIPVLCGANRACTSCLLARAFNGLPAIRDGDTIPQRLWHAKTGIPRPCAARLRR
jgi:hypothetical protein